MVLKYTIFNDLCRVLPYHVLKGLIRLSINTNGNYIIYDYVQFFCDSICTTNIRIVFQIRDSL